MHSKSSKNFPLKVGTGLVFLIICILYLQLFWFAKSRYSQTRLLFVKTNMFIFLRILFDSWRKFWGLKDIQKDLLSCFRCVLFFSSINHHQTGFLLINSYGGSVIFRSIELSLMVFVRVCWSQFVVLFRRCCIKKIPVS